MKKGDSIKTIVRGQIVTGTIEKVGAIKNYGPLGFRRMVTMRLPDGEIICFPRKV